MSSRTLSVTGHSPSSPNTTERERTVARHAPLIGYTMAGVASLLVWAGVLSLGLQIFR